MIWVNLLFALGWLLLALRTERDAPFLRLAWIAMAIGFSLSPMVAAIHLLPAIKSQPASLKFAIVFAPLAVAVLAYIISRIRKEPLAMRRFFWDRSYEE